MSARLVTLAAVALIVIASTGCHHDGRGRCATRTDLRGDLVFNPGGGDFPMADAARRHWPATTTDGLAWDQTEFTTVLRDTQYPPLNVRDGFYRRFESVRWGRVGR